MIFTRTLSNSEEKTEDIVELLKKLEERQEKGDIIRLGLVGCGQMGSGMIHIVSRIPGMKLCAISDIDPNRPLQALGSMGIDRNSIVVTNVPQEAEDALRKSKYVVTEDAFLLAGMASLDNVVEATGITEIGAKFAWTRVTNGLNVVMLNVETDVTVGVILNRIAQKTKAVYTVASGDEPAVCKMLYDFSRMIGFEVVCLGKGKNNPINLECTPETCREEAISKRMNPRMLSSFIDGTKTMVEMAAVSNATGLLPDVPGMHGPKVEFENLKKVFIPKADGGILNSSGCVDFSTGKIAPGVFAIVRTDDPRTIADMKFVSMGEGPYYLIHRPFHLCSIETPISAAEAVIYGETTVVPREMHSEVVSIAKRDLLPGETVSEIGGGEIFNRIYTYREAREKKAIPMGIAPGGQVKKPVHKGEMLTEDNFSPNAESFIFRLRKMQDDMYGKIVKA